MQKLRKFLITTINNPYGVLYTYDEATGLFVSIEIKQKQLNITATQKIIENIKLQFDAFLSWAKTFSNIAGCEVVEMELKITFEMMWKRYNDPRSSKKKSLLAWNKHDEANQTKAYWYYPEYMRKKGNAEKKYLTTYLNDELWNN